MGSRRILGTAAAIFHTVRGPSWFYPKLPPVLAVAYAEMLLLNLPFLPSLGRWCATLAWLGLLAAYGHVINDIFDLDPDRRAGKANPLAPLAPARRWLLGFALLLSGLLPLFFFSAGTAASVVLLLDYLLATAYSAPPLRLKERGVWGVFADACAVHALPTLFALFLLSDGLRSEPRQLTLFVAAGAWAFLYGVRGIIVHQLWDYENDRKAGTVTLVTRIGPQRARRVASVLVFPGEVTALLALTALLSTAPPLVPTALVIYVGVDLLRPRLWQLPLDPAPVSRGSYIVLADFYQTWLPMALLIQLALRRPAFLVLPLLHVLVFWTGVNRCGRDVAVLLTEAFSRLAARLRARVGRRRPMGGADRPPARVRSRAPFEVIVASPFWTLNGVNVFSANLVRTLGGHGIPARILLTEEQTDLVTIADPRLPLAPDLPVEHLPVARGDGWGAHWGATIRYLEERAPCIYIPNSDWRHSCVSPRLSDRVAIVGVVHSDDPLHYDHVSRLGRYWNAIVTVSRAIATKVIAIDPTFEPRIRTIPIGVSVAEEFPERPSSRGEPLQLIYHGLLIQRQKRILDLPRIVDALTARKVPVELTIVGGGSEQAELLAAARHLLERGTVRFLGVLPNDEVLRLLEQADVFVMTSAFEGLPNALLEAMGRGCVPVVTDVQSGIPEVVRDGVNGFLVPVGDIDAFAGRLARLHQDLGRRRRMALEAYRTVSGGTYRTQDMVQDYLALFQRVLHDARRGRFRRPSGPLLPPPPQVAGVDIFPVDCPTTVSGIGSFPSDADAQDFRRQLDLLTEARTPRLVRELKQRSQARRAARIARIRDFTVIVASPYWALTGVNVFAAHLVGGLRAAGMSAHILLTEQDTHLVNIPDPLMPLPSDVPVHQLPVGRLDGWGRHWAAMIRYLEERAPCVYIPNHDWRHSCVTPMLSGRVVTVGILHGDDPLHYDHVARLGRYWNAIVAVSQVIAERTAALDAGYAERIITIPYGVSIPAEMPERHRTAEMPLAIIYHGVLNQRQKRILDLPRIVDALTARKVPVELTIVGGGSEQAELLAAARHLLERGTVRFLGVLPNDEVLRLLEQADVFVMTSAFEGLPNALLEAMGRGCIPVVTDVQSGIPEVVRDGVNGFLIPIGDIDAFADRLALLQHDLSRRRQMAFEAYRTVRDGTYRTQDMVQDYLALFQRVLHDARRGRFRRPSGPLLPPPPQVAGVNIFPIDPAVLARQIAVLRESRLPAPVRIGLQLARRVRNRLR